MRDVRPTARLREAAAIDDDVRAWLDVMPEAVAHYLDAWALDAGHAYEPGGNTAWVAPVRTRDGEELVLKVGMRHPEAEHEAEALRLWDGAGAVRLHRSAYDDRSLALLLERCDPGTPLAQLPEPEQDVAIAAVLQRIWSTPLSGDEPFEPLAVLCRTWADETEQRLAGGGYPGDEGLVRAAAALLRDGRRGGEPSSSSAPTSTPRTCWPRHASRGCSSIRSRSWATRRTTWCSTCSTAGSASCPTCSGSPLDRGSHRRRRRRRARLVVRPHGLRARVVAELVPAVAALAPWSGH